MDPSLVIRSEQVFFAHWDTDNVVFTGLHFSTLVIGDVVTMCRRSFQLLLAFLGTPVIFYTYGESLVWYFILLSVYYYNKYISSN